MRPLGSARLDVDVPASPHRRLNPLTGRWVLVSAGRTTRPWLGRTEPPALPSRPRHDPSCYLCPGNERASGERNPTYERTFAFTNDFSALHAETSPSSSASRALLQVRTGPGTCRVLCFSPRHDLDLAMMSATQIEGVVDLWVSQAEELGERYRSVLIFENRGEDMGASNPHPHGQLWASAHLPDEPAIEDDRQRSALEASGTPLLLDYADLELETGARVVVENGDWVAIVPFWAFLPFETLVVPRRHAARFRDLDDAERRSLAELLRRLLVRYDNLFLRLFPYSMGWHQAPGHDEDAEHWQLHAHVLPPLRSATTRKFVAGYELFGEAARETTPEDAAERLRDRSEVHFLVSPDRPEDEPGRA